VRCAPQRIDPHLLGRREGAEGNTFVYKAQLAKCLFRARVSALVFCGFCFCSESDSVFRG